MTRKDPLALGAYVFAGGFTLGVQEHFTVLDHLEANAYGVATARANQPDLPVYVGEPAWPLDELRDRGLDFLYGNPPCAAWSQAGGVVFGKDWRDDPRVELTRRHFQLLEELRPRAWAWESVQNAFKRGALLVEELTERANDLGYAVTHLLHDARYLGVPQRRPRYFMVAHLDHFEVGPTDYAAPTSGEALRSLNDPGEPHHTVLALDVVKPAGWTAPDVARVLRAHGWEPDR